jgi:hypothetical protein
LAAIHEFAAQNQASAVLRVNGDRAALFSDCGEFRYILAASLRPGLNFDGVKPEQERWINYLMLNPSTADEFKNDPTLERCQRRAELLGFHGFMVTNLFAYRATNPQDMIRRARRGGVIVGDLNDAAITLVAEQANLIVCAWGKDGGIYSRHKDVYGLIHKHMDKMYNLGTTGGGQPLHPLYQSYTKPLMPYQINGQPIPGARYINTGTFQS